jgi:hypothetical protein
MRFVLNFDGLFSRAVTSGLSTSSVGLFLMAFAIREAI